VNDVKKVIAKLPFKRQTLFFSATMPPEITKLANTILYKPEKVEVTPVSSTAETIKQAVYFVDKNNKRIIYTYKMAPGISEVKGGINVLTNLNYPKEIIDRTLAESK
jgi:superfamily II DNA/RNA helicase